MSVCETRIEYHAKNIELSCLTYVAMAYVKLLKYKKLYLKI
jgi:hypothetical protein